MIAHTLVGPLLQIFFTDHLVAQRRLSLQTVASYRDTFRLLLQFVHRETGIEPVALKIPGLDAEIILRFLDALEKDRGNTVVSRNLRLTAIRSFYRMVALRDPASVGIATRVLAIPLKRANTKVREYVTREEMEDLGFCRPCALVRAARLHHAAHDVQLGCSRLRDLRSSPEPCHLWGQELRSVAWEGSKRSLDTLVAQDRTGSESLVPRVGTIRASDGIPEYSRGAADTVRYPFVVAESG
jgi:Phage integrase, N-terminal SAM-like domain